MVSFSSMSFRSKRAAGFRRPGGIRRGYPRSLLPPVRVIERQSPEVHSQTRDFPDSVQSLMFRSAFDGPSRHVLQADSKDDDARAEGPRLRLAAGSAREPLAEKRERGFDLLAGEE